MAGRPPKTLTRHVLDNSFRARRHYPLLAGQELPWPGFALLQARYRAATSQPERRAIAVEFQTAVTLAHQTANKNAASNQVCRYPGGCPEGSEGIDDGRSRTTKSEDALSHHPHTQQHHVHRAAPPAPPAGRQVSPAPADRVATPVSASNEGPA